MKILFFALLIAGTACASIPTKKRQVLKPMPTTPRYVSTEKDYVVVKRVLVQPSPAPRVVINYNENNYFCSDKKK